MILIMCVFATMFMAFIAYNLYTNYKQEKEKERRKKIAHYKEIISEADELLINSTHLPYTKTLVLMLQNRVLSALTNILECNPSLSSIRTRISDLRKQIEHVQKNFTQGEDNPFLEPTNDRQAVSMLKTIKQLRRLVRIEHNKGKVDPTSYSFEDRRLETLLIKTNISSLYQHCQDSFSNRQWGSAKQFISKGLAVLRNMENKDPWLEKREQGLMDMDQQINAEIAANNQKELNNLNEKKNKDEIAQLFGEQKKKW